MSDLPPPPHPAAWSDRLVALVDAARTRATTVAAVAATVVAGAVFVTASGMIRTDPPDLALPRAPTTATTVRAEVELVVHVAGAVAAPGVYRLRAGARVADALQAAGGPAGDADVHALNLAAPLLDGDRIYVPRPGEIPAGVDGPAGSSTAGPIDLNRATEADLEKLPGIGPATARAIVAWREEHGRFRSVDQLLDVPGIGDAKLDTLRPLVRV